MQEQSIQLGDRHLNHARSPNDAPALVMLHGVTRRWQTFLPMWSSLSQRWQLSAIDFRGHGLSDNMNRSYHVCDYTEDVIAYIHTQFNRPIVLYGHSLGAMVAADVARTLGDRITAVILEDPPVHTIGEHIGQTPLLSFFQAMRALAGDSRGIAEIARELGNAMIYDPIKETRTRLSDFRDAASLRFTASCLKRLDPSVLDPIVQGDWLENFDVECVFRGVQCPCLLIQADPAVGGMLTDDDANSIEGWLTDSIRVNFHNCGHLIHWSRTTELLNCVHGFLESVRIDQASDKHPSRGRSGQ